MIHDDTDIDTDNDVDIDWKSEFENQRYDTAREKQDLEALRQKEWAAIGGDTTVGDFTFRLQPGFCVAIFRGREQAGVVYVIPTARRMIEILRLHAPLVNSLEAAVAAVKQLGDNNPKVLKIYIETNRLLEMIRAQSFIQQPAPK